MFKIRMLLCLVACALISCSSCSMQPKEIIEEPQISQHHQLKFSAQSVVDNCTEPHEVYGFPAQPVPGIPVMIMRHGECLEQPNVVIAIWPGSDSKVNLLYVFMMIEKYVEHLKAGNEFFEAKMIDVGQVTLSDINDTADGVPTYAAIFKLEHDSQPGAKNSHKKIPTD